MYIFPFLCKMLIQFVLVMIVTLLLIDVQHFGQDSSTRSQTEADGRGWFESTPSPQEKADRDHSHLHNPPTHACNTSETHVIKAQPPSFTCRTEFQEDISRQTLI